MIYAGPAAEDAAIGRTGGLPLLPADVGWSRCRDCGGHPRFLARLEQQGAGRRVLQVFRCDNDPGGRKSWAEPGGTVVVLPLDPFPARGRPPRA